MSDIITKIEEGKIKAVLNNYGMSTSPKKMRYWREEMLVLVNAIVKSHVDRKATKIVEKVIYVDKQKSEEEKKSLLDKIVGGRKS